MVRTYETIIKEALIQVRLANLLSCKLFIVRKDSIKAFEVLEVT